MNKKKLHLQKMIAIVNGMSRFKRKGKCVQCGTCCLNEDCEHLIFFKNNQKAICNIHSDKERPKKCTIYPANPPINFDTCGYYFIDIIDNERLKVGEIR